METQILETVDRLFYEQGIRAVGVDTIAAEVGISKRTLYNYFSSKDAIITAYLERRLHPAEISETPPLEQILGYFDRLGRAFASGKFHGCAFVNAVAELKTAGHPANKIAFTFKEERRRWFGKLLRRLHAANPDRLAMQLMLLVDGEISAALVRGDPQVGRTAKDAARALLSAAGVDIGRGKKTRVK